MIYCLQIRLNNGDEYDNDKKYFEPLFSKDLEKLQYIKNKIDEKFSYLKKGIIFIKIEPVIPKKEIKREEVDDLIREITNFF